VNYPKRLSLMIILDSAIVLSAIYFSYYLLHPSLDLFYVPRLYISGIISEPVLFVSSLTLLFGHHVFSFIFRLYQKAWAYASVQELLAIVYAVTLSIILVAVVQYIIEHDIYFRVLVVTWMIHVLFIGGSRFIWRVYRDQFMHSSDEKARALIVGAGNAGNILARQLINRKLSQFEPVAFVDDDPRKQHLQFYGVTVEGKIKDIPKVVEKKKIDHIIIAIPSLKGRGIQAIYEQCVKTNAETKIMPLIEDVMTGRVAVSQFREVGVEDLLGRETIEMDFTSVAESITGRTILVTGAGGSIGSELCRQISTFQPKKIVLLGHGENSIYKIDMELRNRFKGSIDVVPVIADVQDQWRIMDVMDEHRPDVVYHAAAHKHVPLMEGNAIEAVKNNIFGTKNIAEAAHLFQVKKFVLISSDKAVNPTNVMGSTKRIAEMIIQQLATVSSTTFVAVRFGNVLGSSGSVIPLFKRQIQAGGPVTVTDPEMTRYFMTIPEASRLVIQAGALARGGEVFVLDMGEPVKIVDLAKNLIRLSGYSEDEIEITYTGLRPGEKMFEELLNENEIHSKQIFPKIHIGKAGVVEGSILFEFIESLKMKDTLTLKSDLITIANTKDNLVDMMKQLI
jgi:FlaA1/EpsC-like NDP-sugar epimerase